MGCKPFALRTFLFLPFRQITESSTHTQLLPSPVGVKPPTELQVRPCQLAQVLSHGHHPGAGRWSEVCYEVCYMNSSWSCSLARGGRHAHLQKAPVRAGAWMQEAGGTGRPGRWEHRGHSSHGGVPRPGRKVPRLWGVVSRALALTVPKSGLYATPPPIPGLYGLPVLRRAPKSLELQPLRLEDSMSPAARGCRKPGSGLAFQALSSGLCGQS